MNANKVTGVILMVVFSSGPPLLAQDGDALDEALGRAGMKRADLGWQPKGWWPQFPADISYKLRAFDSLFAEPLDTVAYARSLADTAKRHLDPAVADDDPVRGVGHLYQAVDLLGTNPKFGGLRGYSANLIAEPTPLDEAILILHRAAGRPTKYVTFDMESPYPLPVKELAEKVKVIPVVAQPILGQLVLNIVDAHHWAELAFRNVSGDDRMAVTRRLNVGEEQVDAFDYCPEFDDVAQSWDEASLWYAGEKCVQALDQARRALAMLGDMPDFEFDWETPWGWIRIRGGGADQVDGTDTLLIVDLGGNDHYTGPVAASAADRSIGLLLDLAGDDRYEALGPAQGVGLCGIGVLVDARGNDVYKTSRYGQGVGQFGLGLCADLGGRDEYFTEYTGQGCGYFGIGLLFDSAGDDWYTIYADGQGLGGVAGVGILADRRGNDVYTAVRDAKVTKRPSYHSPGEDITVNNAQGCAMGRRGDGADGHSWAGGLGALLDAEGDDHYTSGNWSMGTGYWFGTGILHDGGGDDEYHGVCYSQGTGAHFCIGALIDEGGDDLHVAEVTSNMSVGWGHDFAIGLLVNIGGNDIYDVRGNGLSYSINRSVTALIDVGGNDTYRGGAGHRPGMAIFDDRFRDRGGFSDYFADSTSLGLFLDVGGKDRYVTGSPAKDDAAVPAQSEAPPPFGGSNDDTWLDEPGSPNVAERNFSVGVDRADGAVSFRPRPEKTPSLRH